MKENYLIVVGVDGSEGGRKALRWAVREAQSRGGSVQAVNAWQWDFPELRDSDTPTRMTKQSEALLAGEMDALPRYGHASVSIASEATEGPPARVLVEASHSADLLVLGSHGHSRQVRKVLGSVSEDCIRNATCPVVLVPIHYQDESIPPHEHLIRRGQTNSA